MAPASKSEQESKAQREVQGAKATAQFHQTSSGHVVNITPAHLLGVTDLEAEAVPATFAAFANALEGLLFRTLARR